MKILVSFHFSRTAFELKVFAEVDGSMSNLKQFPAPTMADFPSIVGDEYASLAIEVQTTETILREQDLHVFPMVTAPGESQAEEYLTVTVNCKANIYFWRNRPSCTVDC